MKDTIAARLCADCKAAFELQDSDEFNLAVNAAFDKVEPSIAGVTTIEGIKVFIFNDNSVFYHYGEGRFSHGFRVPIVVMQEANETRH